MYSSTYQYTVQLRACERIRKRKKKKKEKCSGILDNFCRTVPFLLPTCQMSIPLIRRFIWRIWWIWTDLNHLRQSIYNCGPWSFRLWLWGVPRSWSAQCGLFFSSSAVAMIHTPFKSMTYDQQHQRCDNNGLISESHELEALPERMWWHHRIRNKYAARNV